MRQVQQVTDAYEYCRQLTQRASKTFYWGSAFLPPAKRQAIWAIYAFCRKVDDIVDETMDGATPSVGRLQDSRSPMKAINGWRLALTRLYERGVANDDPILRAWEDMLTHYSVPLQPALDLLEGVATDLTKSRYQNFDELSLYCYRVAGTVGLMTSSICGYVDERALVYAVDLGIALQLTNILRDIGEDARKDRIYLPQEELDKFGYNEAELMDGVINDAFRDLLRFQMKRADEYYLRSLPGIELLNTDSRLAIRLSSSLYQRILDRICMNDFNVFTLRASVPMQTKLVTASTYWVLQQFDLYAKVPHILRSESLISSHR